MNRECHHCSETILRREDKTHIERYVGPNKWIYAFHTQCFEEIAGEDYIPEVGAVPIVKKGNSNTQRFEYGTRKFWEITITGKTFTTSWGAMGNSPQHSSKSFGSERGCTIAAKKIVDAKTKKGYKLV